MGLFLICPHCQAKLSLTARHCPACGVEVKNLPSEDRRYFIGRVTAAVAAPQTALMLPVPTPETGVEGVMDSDPEPLRPDKPFPEGEEVSLCEALDRILTKGAVLFGEVMISVADIDLVYLGLQVILASVETARGFKPPGEGQVGPNLFNQGAVA